MDDVKQAARRRELPVQGPLHSQPVFFPLKLLLQPSGPIVELTRPDMLMGRHSEADVRLPLPDISRRHCRFLFTDRAWEVFDLDSLNGIFLNGERVKHAVLRDHDVLTIGGFRFQVDVSGSAATAGNVASAEEFIHRIADAFPETTPNSESQRKAS
jgi:pSer/pThr/pTyr-binding forkhead associated (FHA) protein